MTLNELQAEIANLISQGHGERVVIMSRDAEGNGFNPLQDIALSRYDRVEHESGIEALTPELERQGFTTEDLREGPDVVPAVTLWC